MDESIEDTIISVDSHVILMIVMLIVYLKKNYTNDAGITVVSQTTFRGRVFKNFFNDIVFTRH